MCGAASDHGWRPDPESHRWRRAIERSNADVTALQGRYRPETAFANGTDLTLWLGHRLRDACGFRGFCEPAPSGDALLSRVPVARVRAWPLRIDERTLHRSVDSRVAQAADLVAYDGRPSRSTVPVSTQMRACRRRRSCAYSLTSNPGPPCSWET